MIRKITDQTITSSQIQNLTTTPVELIPAQGSGTVIIPFSLFITLNYGTTPYINLTGNLALLLNTTTIFPNQPVPSSFLGATQDVWVYYLFYESKMSGLSPSGTDNQPVYLSNTGLLNFLDGDGTLDINIEWSIYNI
jgi:hypothetical protein